MRRLWLVFISVLMLGCAQSPRGRAVVVWISIDGMRHDYVSRDIDRLPTLAKLVRDGAHTEALAPVFPSQTFPSHASEATGVTAGVHGIVANVFYDPDTKSMYTLPDDSGLVYAEPIWITAARQHVRSAVVDWPLSYQQRGPVKADYFGQAFNGNATDEQRLDQLIKIWRDDKPADHNNQPLRLLIGYIADVDKAGHRYGPDGAGLRDQLVATDRILGKFIDQAEQTFRATMTADDRLYFVITTDHGMTEVKNLVNLDRMIGSDLLEWTHVVSGANLANIYLDDVPADQRPGRVEAILAKARSYPFVQAWSRGQMPAKLGYDQTARAGDIILNLKPGYAWSKRAKAIVEPAHENGQIGVHGYLVDDEPDMLGFAVIYSPQVKFGSRDLGRIDSLQLHPTVAKLLGISPAPGAKEEPIDLRGRH